MNGLAYMHNIIGKFEKDIDFPYEMRITKSNYINGNYEIRDGITEEQVKKRYNDALVHEKLMKDLAEKAKKPFCMFSIETNGFKYHYRVENCFTVYDLLQKYIDSNGHLPTFTENYTWISEGQYSEIEQRTNPHLLFTADINVDNNTIVHGIKDEFEMKSLDIVINDVKASKINDNRIKGKGCDFNFYVIDLNTQDNNKSYSEPSRNLTLGEAKNEFEIRCGNSPIFVNTILGVCFTNGKDEKGFEILADCDLLQCIKGTIRLSDDYLKSDVLANESIIAINSVNILKEEFNPVFSKDIVGEIDYLSPNGKIGENICFTDESQFHKSLENDRYYGVPIEVTSNLAPQHEEFESEPEL